MKEALKLALEALEPDVYRAEWAVEQDREKAITAIKAALAQPTSGDYAHGYVEGFNDACMPKPAQPEQEPVAFPRQAGKSTWTVDTAFIWRVKHTIDPDTPNDFTPSEEQIETVLLALEKIPSNLYTTPPQRKPLTRGQIREIEVDVALNISFDYITPAEQLCRAIEAAHGIK